MARMDDDTNDTSVAPSQPVKRLAFVYGRRKDTQVDQQGTTANILDSASRNEEPVVPVSKDSDDDRRVMSTAQRASSSTAAPADDDDDDEADSSGAAPMFQFEYRRRMRELDEKFDKEDEHIEESKPQNSPSPPSIPTEDNESLPANGLRSVVVDNVPLPRDADYVSDDPFSGSLSPLTSSQPVSSTKELPIESPVVRRRAGPRARQVVVSDSEPDETSTSSSASPPRHNINTPDLRTPPTPLTSEFEMPTTKKKSEKAKGKAPARDVPPLRFDSEGQSTVAAPRKLNKGKRAENSAKPKTKAPTKKERREALLESSRIAAGRSVEIARTQESKHSLSSFFANLRHRNVVVPTPRVELQSDPIQNEFSSPADASTKVQPLQSAFGAPTGLLGSPGRNVERGTDGQPSTPCAKPKTPPAAVDSEDDEMPEFVSIFQREQEKCRADERLQRLRKIKLAALQQRPSEAEEEDDLEVVQDDMHVIAREEAAQRRSDRAKGSPAKAKARILAMGHRSVPKMPNSRSGLPSKFSEQNLREFAKPSFIRNGKDSKDPLSKKQLDGIMMLQHEQQKLKLIKQREEEWIQKGGRLARDSLGEIGETSLSQQFEAYIEQGLRAVDDADSNAAVEDGMKYDSDEDYTRAARGSASPVTRSEVDSEQELETADTDNLNQSTDEEELVPSRRKSHVRRPARVVDSDEEDRVRSRPRVLVPDSSSLSLALSSQGIVTHRDSGSSMESQTEDENDKENNTKLMFDRSEDKENKAVVRHSTWATLSLESTRTSNDGVRRTLSLSSFADVDVTTSPKQVVRSPLKEISQEDEDPFSLSPSVSKSRFTERILRSVTQSPPPSSSKQILGSPPLLQAERFRRLSALSFDTENDENAAPGDKTVLQPSFLEKLHSQCTPALPLGPLNPLPNGGLSQLFSDEGGSSKAVGRTENEELSLTLDIDLKPAPEVSATLRRKADNIFEKEQEYVAAAGQKDDGTKEVLYVNDHGFLTQTRPEGESPQVYRMTPSQASKFIGTQVGSTRITQPLSERPPLRTLSFTVTPGSPERRPLRRLHRRSASPLQGRTPVGGVNPLAPAPLITAHTKRNAFEVLGQSNAAIYPHNEKLGKSEFVAAEAEESDEDDMFGFGKKKEDEEEDDDDDQDRVVEGLVDDTAMNSEAERPDLVQEKYREHAEEDDKRIQKIHQDAVEGKYRMKRRDRGVGFEDDSEEEDDDYEAHRIRQRIHKKRKIDGDDLEALGQNEEARAFYNAYHQDLQGNVDDEDFAHLQEVVPMMDDDPEEQGEREMVSVDEIRARLREVAQNNMEVEVLNPQDTSWIDETMANEDDGLFRCKVLDKRPGKVTTRRANIGLGPVEFDAERPKQHVENEQQQKMLRSWAKGLGNRHRGTGRSVNGTAVTGHAAKAMSGGGSLRSVRLGALSETRSVPSKVSKAPSMLSTVSDRSGRFA